MRIYFTIPASSRCSSHARTSLFEVVRRAAVRSTVWPAPRAPVNMPSSQGDAPCPCEVARVPCRVPPGPGAPTCRLRASVPASVQVESQDACLHVRRRPRSGASSPRFTPQRPAGLPASLLVTAAPASLWADACRVCPGGVRFSRRVAVNGCADTRAWTGRPVLSGVADLARGRRVPG